MNMISARRRLNILFLGWEGGGNVPPTISAVRALVERGHNVRFLGDDCILDEVRATGAKASGWRRAPNRKDRSPESCFARDWEQPDAASAFRAWAKAIFLEPSASYAEDAMEAAREAPTDMLIGSDLLFGGMVAAEALGLPNALLATNVSLLRLPGHPPFGPGLLPAANAEERDEHEHIAQMGEAMFDSFLPALNEARTRFGLAPLSRTLDQLRPDRLLLATSPSFDLPVASLPDFIRYVGPLLEQPAWIDRQKLSAPSANERPLVLVSLSTTYQGQDATLAAIVGALANLPVQGVVTLGKALEGLQMSAPANVKIVAGASHDDILTRASAVVTHAGHGTTLRALRAGAPIVAMPMGRDQNENAARIEYHGVGIRLDPSAPQQEIAAAVHRVISEPVFAANARKLARAIANEGGGARRFVDEIEALARARDAAGSSPRQAVHRVA